MPSKDLIFRFLGEDVNVTDSFRKMAASAETHSKSISSSFGNVSAVVSLVAVAAAVASVKMAGDFQAASTQLVTGAGESVKNLAKVKDGLLAMAPAVGMGPTALAKAMFLVESAGYRGADGLRVMKAAAEGAKVGGADATVVANGLTTAMTDYAIPTSKAAEVTSKLVATVAAGKSNMQDLSGALSTVLPSAAAAGIGLNQVLGALATMTGQGISAQQSAQDLTSTIASMSNPTSVQTLAMAQMGLSSIDVAKNLGKKGLTGTMDDLSQAILSKMGPSGLVLQSSFNESKIAASSATEMLKKLPPSLQKLGQEFLDNTITQKEWTKALKGQDALTSNLGKEFATTAKNANGFSESLRGGGGSAKTFNALMADMTGGSTGLNTALALTGKHSATFNENVKVISKTSTEAGGNVKGWGETQKDFNTKMAEAAAGVQAMAIRIGTALMPAIQNIVKIGTDWSKTLNENKPALIAVLAVVGTFVAVMMSAFVAQNLYTGAMAAFKIAVGISTAAQFLFNTVLKDNPIGIVITVIAALVAGLIWFFTQTKLGKEIWANFTKFIGEAWQNIVKFITDSVGNVANAMNGIGGFIKSVFVGSANFIIDVFNNVNKAINVVIDGINVALGGVKALSGGAIDLKIGRLPMLPHLATGGTMTRGGLAMVGERGPEVVKLPAGATVYPTGGMPAGGGGGLTIGTFNAYQNQSPREIAQELGWIGRWAT